MRKRRTGERGVLLVVTWLVTGDVKFRMQVSMPGAGRFITGSSEGRTGLQTPFLSLLS